ncbi:MAG: hypothetical protein AABW59_03335 [archaeon]
MNFRLITIALVLMFLASGAFAYYGSGYNQYYYTSNYVPTVYYPSPAYAPNNYGYNYNYYSSYAYVVPTYAYSTTYYRTPVTYGYVTPVVVAPTYVSSTRAYSGISMYYDGDDGWGFSYSRGSVCGYYGYC